MTTAEHLTHAVMGVDWHGWLLLLGVLAGCWMLVVLIIGALFARGAALPPQRNPVGTVTDDAAAKLSQSRTKSQHRA
ncbi:hypothetical protein [Mycolicibacterium chlorophenolicum]|uniref:hypothetical protein n=1 Tax=Mycolicibacterium chlorophenolicum TaxID=37916 RepID=UPI001038E9C3|nr:hypothetical protein [Mycolicibacterium chlorophenolicum]